MKAEDRILGLLSEYLQKTDRLLDRMERTDKQTEQTNRNVETISRAMLEHSVRFNKVNDQILRVAEENQLLMNFQFRSALFSAIPVILARLQRRKGISIMGFVIHSYYVAKVCGRVLVGEFGPCCFCISPRNKFY